MKNSLQATIKMESFASFQPVEELFNRILHKSWKIKDSFLSAEYKTFHPDNLNKINEYWFKQYL